MPLKVYMKLNYVAAIWKWMNYFLRLLIGWVFFMDLLLCEVCSFNLEMLPINAGQMEKEFALLQENFKIIIIFKTRNLNCKIVYA